MSFHHCLIILLNALFHPCLIILWNPIFHPMGKNIILKMPLKYIYPPLCTFEFYFYLKKFLASVSKSVRWVTRTSQIVQLATTYLFISAIQILWNRIKVNSHRDVDLFEWNTKSRATSMILSSVFFFKGAIGEGWFVGSMIFLMVCIWRLDFYFLYKVVISVCIPFKLFLAWCIPFFAT